MKHHHHRLHLLKKMKSNGWSAEELDHAHEVWKNSHDQKKAHHKFFDKIIIWLVFALFLITNWVAMFLLTPLFVLFPDPGIIALLGLLGFALGMLFELIVRDLDHVFYHHHHFFIFTVLPYLSIIGGVIIYTFAISQLPNVFFIERNPVFYGIVYAISFLMPFFLLRRLNPKYD